MTTRIATTRAGPCSLWFFRFILVGWFCGFHLLTAGFVTFETAQPYFRSLRFFTVPTATSGRRSGGGWKSQCLDTVLAASSSSSTNNYWEDPLTEYGWNDRVVTLTSGNKILVEFQQQGATQIGILTKVEFTTVEGEKLDVLSPSSSSSNDDKPPKLIIEIPLSTLPGTTTSIKIDAGQLTTIWTSQHSVLSDYEPSILTGIQEALSVTDPLPLSQVDQVLEDMYQQARQQHFVSPKKRQAWTKKDLQKRIDQIPVFVSFVEKERLEMTLRQMVKGGPRHDQLMDSEMLASTLPPISPQSITTLPASKPIIQTLHRARACKLIADLGGGRFKRMGCQFLSWNSELNQVTLINGGWVAVDAAVRAASEARALASSGTSRGTSADERIIQRLEYLAMTSSSSSNSKQSRIDAEEDALQLDVREVLKAMDLPVSPRGAKEALIRMNIWSTDPEQQVESSFKPQPWSPEVLQAVDWYQTMDQKRVTRLAGNLLQYQANTEDAKDQQSNRELEGRIDLTHLPCLCIDAARTSFRDDAIGVRPRGSTGRNIANNGSKWEILIHTADVSDLYAPQVMGRSQHLQKLHAAAYKRASSRYDLPSGPLHLLPPSLLETLALKTMRALDVDNKVVDNDAASEKKFNRCVTLWVYVDASTGKVLDAGLERTLISTPLALDFQSATDLLHKDTSSLSNLSPSLAKAKAILGVVERDVLLWSEQQRLTSDTTKARDDRLKAREQVDRQIYGNTDKVGGSNKQPRRDDGRDGFRRTRGHRLVDACLDMHGSILQKLLQGAKASFPYVSGTRDDGRRGSAPLRRYVDGMVQRQALSVLCGYGGDPLSKEECTNVGMEATKAVNAMANIKKSFKPTTSLGNGKSDATRQQKQLQAARALAHQLSNNQVEGPFPAMSTGKQSEVVILGFGAVASCKGIQGTLKPGVKVNVSIRNVDTSTGLVKATLVREKVSKSRTS